MNLFNILKEKALKTFKILKVTILRFNDNHDILISNGLAYKTIFAIIPVLAVILAISSIFPSFALYKEKIIEFLLKYVLPTYIDDIIEFVDSFLLKINVLSAVGIIGILYISLDLFISLDNAINKIWSISSRRTFLQKFLIYWALLTVTPIILGGYFYYSGVIRSFVIPLSSVINIGEIYYSFFILLVLEAFIFFLFFAIPNTKVHIGKALITSTLISLSWIVLRLIFTYYSKFFIQTWTIYGSIVALIFFMLWISFNWTTLIFGAEFLNVWQNKLYIENIKFKRNFIFDVAYILLILSDFYKDFMYVGNGISIELLSSKYNSNKDDISLILDILETERIVISDEENMKRYFLRKDVSHLKLSDIENIVIKRLLNVHYITTKEFSVISSRLEKYYFTRKEDIDINIEEVIAN